MNEITRRALVELNRRFYSHHAASFSATRERPWWGWRRLLEYLEEPQADLLRVLDVGCGNGRFADFLLARRAAPMTYLGVDGSLALLEAARTSLAASSSESTIELAELDVTDAELTRRLGAARFHLIALFGLLHHIPSHAGRAGFLARLGRYLEARGILVASFWRFDRLSRIGAKILPWDEYNSGAREPIAVAELEPGDHLLTWAGDPRVPRYCHLADADEIAALTAAAGLSRVAGFESDGSNFYLVLGASDRPIAC